MESWNGAQPLEIHNGDDTFAIAFFPDGEHFVSGGSGKTVRRLQAKDGREIARRSMKTGGTVCDVAVSPDGNWIVSGGNFGVVVWSATTHARVTQFAWPYEKCVWAVHVSPDSTRFATASLDRSVCIWNIPTGECLVGPLLHEDAVGSVKFSSQGDRIATATVKCHSVRVYDSQNGELLYNVVVAELSLSSTPFTWTRDGQLFFVCGGKIQCLDGSDGAVLREWSISSSSSSSSIALSKSESFIVCSTGSSISFWDVSTHARIGPIIAHDNIINCLALSSQSEFLASGGYDKKVTLRDLRTILPWHYFHHGGTCLLHISTALFEPWIRHDWVNAENVLAGEMANLSRPIHETLAYRSLIRARSQLWNEAFDDAEESLRIRPTTVGHIARAVSLVEKDDQEIVLRRFDLVFGDCEAHEMHSLLLIKAILYFVAGKQNNGISRIHDLISTANNDAKYYCHHLLGSMYLQQGDYVRAKQTLECARGLAPPQGRSFLNTVTLIFGWDFEQFDVIVQRHSCEMLYSAGRTHEATEAFLTMLDTLDQQTRASRAFTGWVSDFTQRCIETLTTLGDEALSATNYDEAISQYSVVLSFDPARSAGLLVKRSKARAQKGLWLDALEDGNRAINLDSSYPWGYEAKYTALLGLKRYDEVIEAFSSMLSAMENSPDQEIRQLRGTYISPLQVEAAVDFIIQGVLRICPTVLIDVETGRLCDGAERIRMFKAEAPFKALISSMTRELDHGCILRAVAKYFQYVSFSHVWQGREPSFQDVTSVVSVQNLDSSPLNHKLRKFCEVVREEGYRWAWSDTCCIDKTNSTAWTYSLVKMYEWYGESAATLVYLATVSSPSSLGDLTRSTWMTRAWTLLELLAPKVIRFYDSDWKPYLNDTHENHKDSPEIMQELATSLQVCPESITSFQPDDLQVRDKLRLASTRTATVEEDMAYSLIGVFKSDIQPQYGEGDAALGRLLEEIVTRSGEVTVLSWTGRPSRYNSCLPATLSVYGQTPYVTPPISDEEMETQVAALRPTLTETQAILIYDRITRLPPARFENGRLHLPCIVFAVKRFSAHESANGLEHQYRARVSPIGHVTFQTSELLSFEEPRKFVFVHPWIRDLCNRSDTITWTDSSDGEKSDSDTENELVEVDSDRAPAFLLEEVPPPKMDDYTCALRLITRLGRPFSAMLLQQMAGGGYKRVATEHEIIVPRFESQITSTRDVRAEVLDIL